MIPLRQEPPTSGEIRPVPGVSGDERLDEDRVRLEGATASNRYCAVQRQVRQRYAFHLTEREVAEYRDLLGPGLATGRRPSPVGLRGPQRTIST